MEKEKIIFALDELDYLMEKVSRVHGDNHPELIKIKDCYHAIKDANGDENIIKEEIKKASLLSKDFLLPEDACTAYTRVYNAFKILEEQYK